MRHPTENRSVLKLHIYLSESSGAANLIFGTTARSFIFRSKFRGTCKASDVENYCAKFNPPNFNLPSLVIYRCSGARPMCMFLAVLCKKFKASNNSRHRHLISRSPGISSFLVASKTKLDKLYSIGSVANTIYF